MSDFILHLRLGDIQILLRSGHPPIYVQLLCIIFSLMALKVYRSKQHRRSMQNRTSQALQWMLVLACFAVVSEEQWLPYWLQDQAEATERISHLFQIYG